MHNELRAEAFQNCLLLAFFSVLEALGTAGEPLPSSNSPLLQFEKLQPLPSGAVVELQLSTRLDCEELLAHLQEWPETEKICEQFKVRYRIFCF